MKIRTDFVTNSSSDSYAEVLIDNLVLLEILQRYKDMGVFGDAEPTFWIGAGFSSKFVGNYKTLAFYLDEDVSQGTPTVTETPDSLDKVLTCIIDVMDTDRANGSENYDMDLFEQMKEELQNREAEIKTWYTKVWWRHYYPGSDFWDEGPNENEWIFSYDPENGEKFTIGYYEDDDHEKTEDYLATDEESNYDEAVNNTIEQIEVAEQSEELVEESDSSTENMHNCEVMSFEETIAHHLQNSIAVPLSKIFAEALAPLCVEAIKAVNDHDLDRVFVLPLGIKWVELETGIEHAEAPAYEFVRIYDLTKWLNEE